MRTFVRCMFHGESPMMELVCWQIALCWASMNFDLNPTFKNEQQHIVGPAPVEEVNMVLASGSP